MRSLVALVVLLVSGALLSAAPARAATTGPMHDTIAGDTAKRAQADPRDADATSGDREASLASGPGRTPQVLAALAIVGQSILIAGLLLQARRRRITERALLDRQEELRWSQGRYELASAAGAVGVWDWNFATNELFVDPVLKGLLGFDDREISTRPDDWGSRVHPDDLPKTAAGIKLCLDGLSDTYEIEHRMFHKDGSVKWVLSRGSAIRSADGTVGRLVGTKVDITHRKQSEEVIRENQVVLNRSHEQIQELAGQLIASQEVERARIARDLHDDLSQQIAALSIALRRFRGQLAARPQAADLDREVSSLQGRTIGLADQVRRLSHDLHPSVLDRVGLVPALSEYCAEVERQQPVAVVFTAEGDFSSTTGERALCLYRIVQEGLRNVVSHAKAGRAQVRLERIGDRAELTIADDGRGFDVVEAGKHRHGLGLVSITERVRLAGGTVSIVSEMNAGTRVHVQISVNGHGVAAPGA